MPRVSRGIYIRIRKGVQRNWEKIGRLYYDGEVSIDWEKINKLEIVTKEKEY